MDDKELKQKELNIWNKVSLVAGGAILVFCIIMVTVLFLDMGDRMPELDGFAECVVESGAKMYGLETCPHCQNQKERFGNSWEIIEDNEAYVECSIQQELCEEKEVNGVPLWILPDGTRVGGDRPLSNLAEATGCQINE